MNTYDRIFGAGPKGGLLSLLLLLLAWHFEAVAGLPSIIDSHIARWVFFALALTGAVAIIVWSLKSLPPSARGKHLVTTGVFRYLRHPLYAAFLSVFDFGFAVLLNNWIYILWAITLHPIWHWVITGEERLMNNAFPEEYEAYCEITGRFIPRISSFQHNKPI